MANEIAKHATNAVATVRSIMGQDAVKARFNEILGKKAAGFMSSVISVSNSAALIGSDPTTVLNAAVVAATLDLPINQSLGLAYIVPYNSKNGKQAQFQLGYKGLIQLAQRSGMYKTINATEVREGELVEHNILTGEIKLQAVAEREKKTIIGYAAYFELLNGFNKTIYMTKAEMEVHAKRYSQSYRNDKYNSSLWSTDFDAMAKKTVIKQLISKFGPLSIEMQMAQKFDQAVVAGDAVIDNVDEAEVVYIDNSDAEAAETPKESAADALANLGK